MASPFDAFADELKAALIDGDRISPRFDAVIEGRRLPDDDRTAVALLISEEPVEEDELGHGASFWRFPYLIRIRDRRADNARGSEAKDREEQACQAVAERYRYAQGINLITPAITGLRYTTVEILSLDDDDTNQLETVGRVRVSFWAIR